MIEITGYCLRFGHKGVKRGYKPNTDFHVPGLAPGQIARVNLPILWCHTRFEPPPGFEGMYQVGRTIALKQTQVGLLAWGQLYHSPWITALTALIRYGILRFSASASEPPTVAKVGRFYTAYRLGEVSVTPRSSDPDTLVRLKNQIPAWSRNLADMKAIRLFIRAETPMALWPWLDGVFAQHAEFLLNLHRAAIEGRYRQGKGYRHGKNDALPPLLSDVIQPVRREG